MLQQEEIDNWDTELADAEVFDRVNERMDRGVTKHREMRANEVVPYVRHARRLQGWLALALLDLERRNAEAMTPGKPETKYL